MFNAHYTVKSATHVITLPQSYNHTVRFIKFKYILQVGTNVHTLPLETLVHITLPTHPKAALPVDVWKSVHELRGKHFKGHC